MKNISRRNISGFTLIELLVVVLIIGILSAVAVPQYELAVMKTRGATLLPILKNIVIAQDVYYMANGKYSTNFEELDIAIPEGGEFVSSQQVKYPKWEIMIEGQQVTGTLTQGSNLIVQYQMDYSYKLDSGHFPGQQKCIAFDSGKPLSEKLCKHYGGKVLTSGSFRGIKWRAWQIP